MSFESESTRRLREQFAAIPRSRDPAGGCPDADCIWAAVTGELSAEETGLLVDHTLVCSECAEAWRLALEIARPSESLEGSAQPQPRHRFWSSPWIPLAAAAALVLLVLVPALVLRESAPSDPVLRGPETRIESLLGDDTLLPRDDFVLRWSPGPEGATYRLTVTTAGLDLLLERRELAEPAFRVPPEALSGVADGERVYWRVEAAAPDGSVIESPVFRAGVQ